MKFGTGFSMGFPVTIDRTLRDRAYSSKDLLDGTNREITPVLRDVRQRMNLILGTPYRVTPSGGKLALNWSLNRQYAVTLSQDITSVSFTNPADSGPYWVRFEQVGGFSVTGWPDTVRFLRGIVPKVTQAAGASDSFQLFFDGSQYWAEISQGH